MCATAWPLMYWLRNGNGVLARIRIYYQLAWRGCDAVVPFG